MSPGLGDRLRARINLLVADPAFQRWAAGFPLTRRLARRRSRQLFDIVAGFVYTQVLLAALRLRLFEHLAAGPRSVEELAPLLGLPADSARRLAGAAAALELLERQGDGRYALGPVGAPLLGRPEIAALVEHDTLLYADLADPVALLRAGPGPGTHLARYWAYATADRPAGLAGEHVADYSALMAASQPLVAADVLDAYDVRRHRRLLDVGGGEGRFLEAVAARAPALELTLLDLPPVVERARVRLAAAGLGERVRCVAGSFLSDPLPDGADLVTLIRVAHDHDDAPVQALFARIHGALAPGGTLLIGEPMAGLPGAETVGDCYFAFYLLAMGSGRARTPEEYGAMLRAAGFRSVDRLRARSPIQTGVIAARK